MDLHPCWRCSKGVCRLGKGKTLRWNPSACEHCINLASMFSSLVPANSRRALAETKNFIKGLSACLKIVSISQLALGIAKQTFIVFP